MLTRAQVSTQSATTRNVNTTNASSFCKVGSLDSQMALRTVIETGRSLNGSAGEIAAQTLLSSGMGDPTLLKAAREAGLSAAQTAQMAADVAQVRLTPATMHALLTLVRLAQAVRPAAWSVMLPKTEIAQSRPEVRPA